MHQNHLEVLLKHRLLGCTPRMSDSLSLGNADVAVMLRTLKWNEQSDQIMEDLAKKFKESGLSVEKLGNDRK